MQFQQNQKRLISPKLRNAVAVVVDDVVAEDDDVVTVAVDNDVAAFLLSPYSE